MGRKPPAAREWLLVSRHEGAQRWLLAEAHARGWHPVRLVSHLGPEEEAWEGACGVAGTLPLPLISRMCNAGIAVWQLDLPLDAATRGRELSTAEMVARGARLRQVSVMFLEEAA